MFYSTGQVTKILNISRPTLYKLCEKKHIDPQRTVGGNYRFSEEDLRKLMGEKIDEMDIEDKFIAAANDVWIMLKKLSEEIWGIEQGERKLVEILQKNKNDIFILNITSFNS